MQELLPFLRALTGDTAEVTTHDIGSSEAEGAEGAEEARTVGEAGAPSIRTAFVAPRRPGAAACSIVCEQWLVVEVGRHGGGRWELGHDDAGVAMAKQLLAGVIAGRVVETIAPGRSRVVVTLDDGTTATETGYRGCLTALVVLPGWTRWGTTVRYEPYQGAEPCAEPSVRRRRPLGGRSAAGEGHRGG